MSRRTRRKLAAVAVAGIAVAFALLISQAGEAQGALRALSAAEALGPLSGQQHLIRARVLSGAIRRSGDTTLSRR